MSGNGNKDDNSEDDKPTVVLDLNALKKQKQKQEEDLVNIVNELEFSVPKETPHALPQASVILFDFQSDFFRDSLIHFPKSFKYIIVKTLPELTKLLASKTCQFLVLNYDANSKAANQISAQVKQKFPAIKTIIVAKNISPEKAKLHQKTPSGAHGYYQLPFSAEKIEKELRRIMKTQEKAS